MFLLYFSHNKTEADKGSRSKANSTKSCKALLEGHHGLVEQIVIVRHFSVDHVRSESLHSQVELVLPKAAGGPTHPEVGPSGVQFAVKVLVVFDRYETLLKDVRVEKGVQGVTAHRQSIDLSWHNSAILLLGQVLYRNYFVSVFSI